MDQFNSLYIYLMHSKLPDFTIYNTIQLRVPQTRTKNAAEDFLAFCRTHKVIASLYTKVTSLYVATNVTGHHRGRKRKRKLRAGLG